MNKATYEQMDRPWAFPDLFDDTLFDSPTPTTHRAFEQRFFSTLEELAKANNWKVNFWKAGRSGSHRVYLNDESGEAVAWQELNGGRQNFVHKDLTPPSKARIYHAFGQYLYDTNKWYRMAESEVGA